MTGTRSIFESLGRTKKRAKNVMKELLIGTGQGAATGLVMVLPVSGMSLWCNDAFNLFYCQYIREHAKDNNCTVTNNQTFNDGTNCRFGCESDATWSNVKDEAYKYDSNEMLKLVEYLAVATVGTCALFGAAYGAYKGWKADLPESDELEQALLIDSSPQRSFT